MSEHNDALEAAALKPCPFCGCAPNQIPQNDDCRLPDKSGYYQTIWCENCGAESGKRHTDEAAIEAWNTRTAPATQPSSDAVREALRFFLKCAYPVSTSINPRGYNWSEAYLDQARVAAAAALAQPQAAGTWQPIETAPRNMTPIEACNTRHPSHAPVIVRWTDKGGDPHWCDEATPDGSALYFNANYFDYWKPVTPLPAPPAAEDRP